jgi:hypothetical protein
MVNILMGNVGHLCFNCIIRHIPIIIASPETPLYCAIRSRYCDGAMPGQPTFDSNFFASCGANPSSSHSCTRFPLAQNFINNLAPRTRHILIRVIGLQAPLQLCGTVTVCISPGAYRNSIILGVFSLANSVTNTFKSFSTSHRARATVSDTQSTFAFFTTADDHCCVRILGRVSVKASVVAVVDVLNIWRGRVRSLLRRLGGADRFFFSLLLGSIRFAG